MALGVCASAWLAARKEMLMLVRSTLASPGLLPAAQQTQA